MISNLVNENIGNISQTKSLDNLKAEKNTGTQNLIGLRNNKLIAGETNAGSITDKTSISQQSKSISELNNYLETSQQAIQGKLATNVSDNQASFGVENHETLSKNLETLKPIEGIEKGETLISTLGKDSQTERVDFVCINYGACDKDPNPNLICGNKGGCDDNGNLVCGNNGDCGDDDDDDDGGGTNLICGNRQGDCDGKNLVCWDSKCKDTAMLDVPQAELLATTEKIENVKNGLESVIRNVTNSTQQPYSRAGLYQASITTKMSENVQTINTANVDRNSMSSIRAARNTSAVQDTGINQIDSEMRAVSNSTRIAMSSNQVEQTLNLFR